MKNFVVAVTGASGAPYSQRLLQCLADDANVHTHLVISPYGRQLFYDELGIKKPTAEALVGRPVDNVTLYNYNDVGAKIASGSFLTDGMIICPCSSSTLGAVASGLGDNLINRAATVTLKELRRLIIVQREMPVSQIELENMLRLSRAGAVICPASPGFYLVPKTLEEIVDFVVGKILDLAGVAHQLNTRWDPGSDGPHVGAVEPTADSTDPDPT